MNVEGSVHVIWLNRQAENETPIFAVTWSPYATPREPINRSNPEVQSRQTDCTSSRQG